MMSPADHDTIRALIPAAALSALEEAEMQEVLSHAATCDECSRSLAEYRDVVVALDAAVPTPDRDEQAARAVRERLLARARAERGAGPRSRGGLRKGAELWSGWAVAASLAGLLVVHHSVHRPLNYGWLVAGALMLALVGVFVYARVQAGRAAALRDRVDELAGRAGAGRRGDPLV